LGGSSGTGANPGIGGAGAGGQGEGGEGGEAGSAGNGGSTPTGGTNSGGGGSTGVSGGGSSSGGGTGGGSTVPPELIENMEDGNLFILANDKRTGNWYTAFDAAKSSKASDPAMVAVTDSPSKGSTKAFYFKGDGSGGWGALAAFDFIYVGTAAKKPYDGSTYKGITFYAKAAAATTVTVRVPIVDTTANAMGSTCTPAPATMPTCEDHYAVDVPLTTSWAPVAVAWADLHQVGWGAQTWNAAELVSVQFFVDGPAEFWIDDISFIK
jgi:hypothetical protein